MKGERKCVPAGHGINGIQKVRYTLRDYVASPI